MRLPHTNMEDSVSGNVIEEKPFKRPETLEERVAALEARNAALEALVFGLLQRAYTTNANMLEPNTSALLSRADKTTPIPAGEWEAVKRETIARIMAQSR